MTFSELSTLLGKNQEGKIYKALRMCDELSPEMAALKKHNNLVPNYTEKEIRLILICMGMNEIQQEIVLDLFDEYSKEKKLRWVQTSSIYIDGNEEFVERCGRDKSVKACGNCVFLIGKTIVLQDMKKHPYCDFYRKYIFNMEVEKRNKIVKPNIFTDRCNSWRKSEPHLFLKD